MPSPPTHRQPLLRRPLVAAALVLGLAATAGLGVEAEVRQLGEERYGALLDSAIALVADRDLGDEGSLRAGDASARDGFLFVLDRRGRVVLQPEHPSGPARIQPSVALRMLATGSGTLVQTNGDGDALWCVYRPLESPEPGKPGGAVAGWAVPLKRKRAAALQVRRWWVAGSVLGAGLALLLVRRRRRPAPTGPVTGDRESAARASDTRSMLDAMQEAVVATDLDTRVTFLNHAAAALSPLDPTDALAERLDVALPLADAEGRGLSRLAAALSASEPQSCESWLYVLPGKDERSFEVTAVTTEAGAVLVLRDVTQRARFDARSRERGHMETIGRVAAGLAHDVNNLLGTVRGNAELLLLDLPVDADSAELRETAASILGATVRGSELTSKLLAYSQKPETSQRIDCHALIEGVLAIAGRTLGPGITLRRQLAAEEFTVLGDERALESALLHLAGNARDAMAGQGALTVATSNSSLPSDDDRGRPTGGVRPAIRITLRDEGPGMDESTRRRVFDPFFTTKNPGEGTGLGLAAVYGAVVGHGGDIQVESTLGAGTAFHVRLPLADPR